jgi:hypothetical protein
MRITNPDGTKTTLYHRNPATHLLDIELLTGQQGLCKCTHWAREGGFVLWTHHRNCEHANHEYEAYKTIKSLVDAMELWGREEDGIPSEVWDAYKRACGMIGKQVGESEAA